MSMKKISIKWKLVGVCILLVSIPVGTLGIWAYYSSKQEVYRSTENKLREQATMVASHIKTAITIKQEEVDKAFNVAQYLLSQNGRPALDYIQMHTITAMNKSTKTTTTVKIPAMTIGEEHMLDNTRIVDEIQQLVGGTTGIFQVISEGLLCLSTNVLQTDGSRATREYIPTESPVYQAIMSGTPYRDREHMAETWFETLYQPLKDVQGKIIGALSIGQEDASETVLDNLATLVVGKTGYAWVLAASGAYVLSHNRERDGENILDAQDADGRYFLREWIENAKHLAVGESIADYHYWKNPGETKPRLKISTYAYIPEREWLVGAGAYLDDFSDQLVRIRSAAIAISIAGIFLSTVVAYLFMSAMVKKFKFLASQMREVADGNLTLTFPTVRQDEIGTMSHALQNMSSTLRGQISEIAEGVNVLASSASEISASVTQLASGAAETSTSVGETTTTLEEVRQTAQLANQKSQSVSASAQKAAQIAQDGRKATNDTVMKMNRIREQMTSIADSIVKLSEQSQAIGNIIATVGDLADQSNLLAVNASIEATKAGEQGKGFTVVAQEIRSLAEQSKQATTQIQTILNNIQKATNAAVMATEQGGKAVEAGAKQAADAGDAIQSLANSVVEAAQAMSQIAISSQEQTVGMNQIAEAMESIRQASVQNVDSSHQLETSAANLQELGNRLQQLVAKYTV